MDARLLDCTLRAESAVEQIGVGVAALILNEAEQVKTLLTMFYSSGMRRALLLVFVPCLIAAGQASNQSGTDALTDYQKGDLAHARTKAEALHAANPGDLSVAVLLANIYIKLGRESQAVDLLTPLEPGHETDMELEYSLGFAQLQSGRETEGLPRMEKAARATRSVSAWIIAGASRLHRNEFAEAKTDLDAAIELDPSLPGLYSMEGQVRFALGETEEAHRFFQAALRADPRDFIANLYTGMYWLEQGDFESARRLLELALQLQPEFPLARLQMARLNSMTGNYSEAVKALEDLERANPDWPDPHSQLAALYYKVHRAEDGQRERAIVQQIEARQQKEGPRNQ